ncbi:MAG: hypothetical protein QM788_14165 [Roseateles sp.]|uniref:hypothetical protein n=1 Tax=Roseateles sp. TaxID=1971397 RepID=UPI0039E733A4
MKHHILFLAALLGASSAFAQVTIDQNKAMAGNVTPGDTPGFPVTINQPGSYKLTGNLTVPPGVDGILVKAENVTLDLNGFTIRGATTCTMPSNGYSVTCSSPSHHAGVVVNSSSEAESVVRNGTVQGFWRGVVMTHGRVHDLSVLHNKIGLFGNAHLLASRITARMNETGVQTNGLVSDSWAMFNSVGFRSNESMATLINSAASLNAVGVYRMSLNTVNASYNGTDKSFTSNF